MNSLFDAVMPTPTVQETPEQKEETSEEKEEKEENPEKEEEKEEREEEKKEEETPHAMVIRMIQQQRAKEEANDIWCDSPYKDLVKLQSNNAGNVGESFIDNICKSSGIDADCDGSKTKQRGGGRGDGVILGVPVEIKTAHQGSSSSSFQHELGEVPWNGGDYMIFIDIAPFSIYLTIFKNFTEATYKSGDKLECFPSKSVTWRKNKGAFKLDTSIKINEQSVANNQAIKITPTTPNAVIATFIRRVIKCVI